MLMVIAAATLVAAGAVVWQQSQTREAPQAPETGQPQTEQPQQAQDELEGSPPEALAQEGWQTYRNEEYGFGFKYPLRYAFVYSY